MERLLRAFVVAGVLGTCAGADVLVVVPTPAKSHHNLMERLALEMASKGHQVTFLTPYRQAKPVKNLNEIIFPDYYDQLIASFTGKSEKQELTVKDMRKDPLTSIFALHGMGLAMTDTFLSFPAVKDLVSSKRKFHLVVGEAFFVEAVLAGLAKTFDAPLVAVATGIPGFYVNHLVGNPAPSSYVPSVLLGYSDRMSFFERVLNLLFETSASIYQTLVYMPKQDALLRKHFRTDLPYISDILSNTSLVLINHHSSLAFPRPYLPSMIEIGGYHVRPPQPLPTELKQFMDSSKNGVILFSLGSHLKGKALPKKTVDVIVKTFSRLKQNIVWKFEEDIPNLSKNVKIMKWLPQSDLLAHPNTKLFITHGGLLSTTEAIVREVPILGVPVFGDQPLNMLFAERKGIGRSIVIEDITEQSFYVEIMELLSNSSYKENVKKASLLLRDTPRPAIDTAMYWLEYVMRHKGAPHLRSEALNLSWYELYLVDVFGVIFAALAVVLWITYSVLKCAKRMLCGGSKKQKASSAKKRN